MSEMRTRGGRRFAGLVAVLLAALVAGCGGDAAPEPVAEAVPPAPLPVETSPPPENAVEPVAGGGDAASPAVDSAADPDPSNEPEAATRAAGGRGRILSAADRASFARLAASIPGDEGLAVSALGLEQPVERVGTLRSAVAWSTAKVPVAMAVIAAGEGQRLRSDLRAAITASDNGAATRLWNALGGDAGAASAADRQLRAAGDARTSVESRTLLAGYTPFGQTRWALTDQVRFTAGLACTGPGEEVLGLMGEVVDGQRWGLGSVGSEAALKGGWGPGSEPGVGGGYLDRQMGVVSVDGTPLAVAIAVRPSSGSHDAGTRALTTLARWVADHASVRGLPAQADC